VHVCGHVLVAQLPLVAYNRHNAPSMRPSICIMLAHDVGYTLHSLEIRLSLSVNKYGVPMLPYVALEDKRLRDTL
jgi:hypothetical protein